jgi:hypothetical protein
LSGWICVAASPFCKDTNLIPGTPAGRRHWIATGDDRDTPVQPAHQPDQDWRAVLERLPIKLQKIIMARRVRYRMQPSHRVPLLIRSKASTQI